MATTLPVSQETMEIFNTWKPKLSQEKREWVHKLVTETEDTLAGANMPLSVAFGMACAETGYGQAGAANPWGMRGAGDAGSDYITTHEQLNHVVVKQHNQKFAKFSSLAAAARGYASFVSGPRYKKGWAYRDTDHGKWLLWVWGQGYGTADNYPPVVVDASRNVAKVLDRPELIVQWTDEHRALKDAIADAPAGPKRWAKTQELLG